MGCHITKTLGVALLTMLLAAPHLLRCDQERQKLLDAYCERMVKAIEPQWQRDPAGIQRCLERIQRLMISDPFYFYCRVVSDLRPDGLHLEGEVERGEFREIILLVLEKLGFETIVDRIEVVPDTQRNPEPFGIVVSPFMQTCLSPDNDVPMDEALFSEPVYILKELSSHFLIKTFSGYWGYAKKETIRRLPPGEYKRYVSGRKVRVGKTIEYRNLFIPAGSQLLLKNWGTGNMCRILGALGDEFLLPKTSCRRITRDPLILKVLQSARLYLGSPYNFAGKNIRTGVDCSGLIQLCYRSVGINLPRDAGQQYSCGNLVAIPSFLQALRPGDALFFVDYSGRVDHVALYLGSGNILHATGEAVQIHSIDPKSKQYFQRFATDFLGAKRFLW